MGTASHGGDQFCIGAMGAELVENLQHVMTIILLIGFACMIGIFVIMGIAHWRR